MINYFLKVTICWGLFYLIYTLFLSKETFFNINRWYLLGTLILGLVIPIIPINIMAWFPQEPTAVVYIEPIVETVQRVETVIAVQTAKEEISYGLIFFWLVYAIGVLVCLGRFGKGLWKIYQLYQSAEIHQKGNYKLVLTNQGHLPFSFFNYLFWSKDTHLEDKDAGTIITHEVAHINQWHSIDTLFLEWLSILLWFSPPIYWYKKSLKDIHEYLADAYVLKDTKTKQYGHLLLKQAQSGMQLALASHFLDSQLKKRILMMTRNQSSNQALMKYLSALPLLVLMVMVFSNPQVRANLNATAQLSIDYLNPNVNVPNIPRTMLFWVIGDFDKEKAKEVLAEAYACRGCRIIYDIRTEGGGIKTIEKEGDHIKELHTAAIFLIQKFPAHKNEIHELAAEVARENGIGLRFHENGESIIYRDLTLKERNLPILEGSENKLIIVNGEIYGTFEEGFNQIPLYDIDLLDERVEEIHITADNWMVVEVEGEKRLIEIIKESNSSIPDSFSHRQSALKNTANKLILINNKILGIFPEGFSSIKRRDIETIIEIPASRAVEKYGEQGINGALNIYTEYWFVTESNGEKVLEPSSTAPPVRDNYLVLINGTIVGFSNEVFKEEIGFSAETVRTLPPDKAIEKYGKELGKNGSMNFISDELLIEIENGKKVIKNLNNQDIRTITRPEPRPVTDSILFIVNGVTMGYQPTSFTILEDWIKNREHWSKEDIFMRGIKYKGKTPTEAISFTLVDDYTVIKDVWGQTLILPKNDPLSSHYTDDRKVFLQVDEMPRLQSCSKESSYQEQLNCTFKQLSGFLYDNIQYPPDARWNGIEGTVNVQFTIDLDGAISNLYIAQSKKYLDEEVIRVMNLLNEQNIRWTPGRQNAEDVRVVKNIPIEFSIGGDGNYSISVMKLQSKEFATPTPFMKSFVEKIEANFLQINISPNPAHKNINLSIKGSKKPLFIQVTDMVGRRLYEQKIEDFSGNSVETILFEEVVKGMVVVTISQGGHSVQEKVVVR